jgi:hypothetical protein
MTNFVLDGTSLPFPKVDLVPLGSAPANKYTIATDWNTVCQASVDMQGFLRGNFMLFKTDDLSTRAALILSDGAPVVNAAKGSLALDITTPAVYQNQDGVATWLPLAGGGGSMAIGSPVTGGTSGSMLYVGAGTFLQQDNANLYFDNVNKRVGIGTNAPGTTLDLASGTTVAGLALRAGSTTGVSAGSTGRLRYNEGTQRFQVSMNGAAYVDLQTGADFTLDIGDSIGSSTVGSILFVGAGGLLAQDNTNLFWDDTNNALTVITASTSAAVHARNASSTAGAMSIRNTNVSGPVDFYAIDSGGTAQMSWGYGNASYGDAGRASRGYVWRNTGVDFVIARTGVYDILVPALGGMEFANSTSAVSAANTGRIRYTTTGQKFQVSYNGAAYVDLATGTGMAIGGTITSATAGSILFAGAAGILQQDNANFFWDDSNNRLGIGTNAPDSALRITSAGTHALRIQCTLDAGHASFSLIDDLGNSQVASGWGNTAVTDASRAGKSYWGTNGTDFVVIRAFGTPSTITTTFTADGGVQVHGSTSAVSAASTGRLRYDTASQRLQLSNNGAAYGALAMSAAAFTQGSVPFANGIGQLAQDNANLFFDDTNNRLGIGTNLPVAALHVVQAAAGGVAGIIRAAATDGFSSFNIHNSADALQGAIGYANASIGVNVHLAGLLSVYSNGPDLVYANNTRNEFRFGLTTGSTYTQMHNGSGAAVSDANTGRIRYNTTGQKFQLSTNGAAYFDLVSTAPTVERLNADGAADPALNVTYVSGTGTDLTLANGTIDGFIKHFVITGGDGTITPANLADGDVLTWTAGPANVSFIWDATGTTWHVHGNPYNMVTT